MLYSHTFLDHRHVVVGTANKFLMKLNDGTLLQLDCVKESQGEYSVDVLSKAQLTTMVIPIPLTSGQIKQIATIGIERIRFTTMNDESIEDKTNRITNKNIMEVTACLMQY